MTLGLYFTLGILISIYMILLEKYEYEKGIIVFYAPGATIKGLMMMTPFLVFGMLALVFGFCHIILELVNGVNVIDLLNEKLV